MSRLLLLGSYGFIGTNILSFIDNCHLGYEVVAFDRFPQHPSGINFDCVKKVYAGDFSDKYLLQKVFEENDIDIVVHSLSASVPSSSQDNEFDVKFNVLPTIGLLNMMVKYGVKKIAFISSGGAIYGDHYVDKSGHIEEEVLFPKSAYGVSKLVIEKYLYLYAVQHGVYSLVLRLSNPYGPWHYSQKQGIVNIALERAIRGESLEIWGDGNGKKDYIYIEDFCSILIKLIENWSQAYTVVNVGSGKLLSVNDIVKLLKEEITPDFNCIHKDANSFDVQDFRLNLSKLNSIIGEFCYTDLKNGVNKTRVWLENKSFFN